MNILYKELFGKKKIKEIKLKKIMILSEFDSKRIFFLITIKNFLRSIHFNYIFFLSNENQIF